MANGRDEKPEGKSSNWKKTRRASSGGRKRRPAEPAAPADDEQAPADDEQATGDGLGFPVVCLVGSAGGLNAYNRFFDRMPAPCGMAFLVVPHLDPRHDSLMVELLAKHTGLAVTEVVHEERIERDHVYVIPPNRMLGIRNGRLELSALPASRAFQTAIDHALRSLAQDQGERAVAIILSGTGNHGAVGLREVKLAGGLVLAQAPDTAEYDVMPRNAIATGLVDVVLAPEDMPRELVEYAKHPYLAVASDKEVPVEEATAFVERVLAVLRARSRRDFRSYRRSMILRRIQRRMGIRQIRTFAEYIEALRGDLEEVTALGKDLLISVTAFFREPGAFEVLEKRVIPSLVEAADPDVPVRVWVPGCATGEEAYSLAILLLEGFAAADKAPSLQIFATDVDEEALEVARAGCYPNAIEGDVSTSRLRRFFVRVDDQRYQVDKQLRESIVFAPQNLITDAPFSMLDLVSCRNVLIYLEPAVQRKVVVLFHFALKASGCLLLGPSESIGGATDLFEPISKQWRVYRRIGPSRRELVKIPVAASGRRDRAVQPPPPPAPARRKVVDLMRHELLEEYAPASVLVDGRHEVLCFLGPVGSYLEFPEGEPTRDLLSIARQGLRSRLRAALHEVAKTRDRVMTGVQMKREDGYVRCTITVRPMADRLVGEDLMLVCFEDERVAAGDGAAVLPLEPPEESSLVQQVEQELRSTREDLQSTIEELESSNEELKASNEEVMSMNEELQSANEELETSKEETQSLNEELSTVNQQLQEKLVELDKTNSDITNLLNSTQIATLFLDDEFRLQRFTPATKALLNLLPTDVGRPIADLWVRFYDDSFLSDCRRVLRDRSRSEKEVWIVPPADAAEDLAGDSRDQRVMDRPTGEAPPGAVWYTRRIAPYRLADGRVVGVVVSFIDITDRKRAEAVKERADAFVAARLGQFEVVMRSVGVGVIVADESGRCILFNEAAERILGRGRTNRPFQEWPEHYGLHLGDGEDLYPWEDLPLVRATRGEQIDANEVLVRNARSPEGIHCLMHAGPLTVLQDAPRSGFMVVRDVTESVRDREEAHLSREVLRSVVKTAPDAVVMIDEHGIIEGFNLAAVQMFGYSADEVMGENVKILMPPPWRDEHDTYIERYRTTREPRLIGSTRELRGRRSDGSVFPIELSVSEIPGVGLFTGMIRDVSERRELQRELARIVDDEHRRIGQDLHDGLGQELAGLGHLSSALAESLESLASRGPEGGEAERRLSEVRRNAVRVVQGLRDAMVKLRTISHELVPMEITGSGLTDALRKLAAGTDDSDGVTCTFEGDPSVEVADRTTAAHLYRIAQEAVSNALKHAHPRRIAMTLERAGGKIVLRVEDDGKGIESTRRSQGLGLKTMQYRAGLIGGALSIGPGRNGRGTLVECTAHEERGGGP